MMNRAMSEKSSQAMATVMLTVVTVLWGFSFVLMKNWQESAKRCPGGVVLASFTLIAMRMILALALLALFRPRLFSAPSRREHLSGSAIGVVFFCGFMLQTLGLAWTTPALSAFITSMGSALVPIIGWFWFRIPVRLVSLLGLGVGVLGAGVLGIDSTLTWSWGPGEYLTLVASMVFAVEILMLDRLGRKVESANLTVAFMGTAGVLAAVGAVCLIVAGTQVSPWAGWLTNLLSRRDVLLNLGLLTVFSTVLAFHWMNVYQPRIPASRAALIYLLEPVFGSAFSIWAGHDVLSMNLLIGGGLILGGNLLVELPIWKRSTT
jgi:drug/metabolite transporter (DMT)-like permease